MVVDTGAQPAPVTSVELARRVVELACRAPSVHNTQPWRWRIGPDEIVLFADPERRLPIADPHGRELVISCGAALDHLRVAAAAMGLAAQVRYGGGVENGTLARVVLRPVPVTPRAVEQLELLRRRCTDRRRFTSWPVPAARLEALAAMPGADGVTLTALTEVRPRWRAEVLVAEATRNQQTSTAYREEQASWVEHSAVDGIPTSSLGTDWPGRRPVSRFSSGRADDRGEVDQVEPTDGLLVISTSEDDPAAWLWAGEALSQLWLATTAEGLSLVPLSQVVELPGTRAELRHRVLATDQWPQLLVRIGWQQIGRSDLPQTPRRPLGEMLVAP